MRTASWLLLFALAGHTADASGQQPPLVVEGQLMRISYTCRSIWMSGSAPRSRCQNDVGTFAGLRGDTLGLTIGDSTFGYVLRGGVRLELGRGLKSEWPTGALIGFLAGSAVALFPLSSGNDLGISGQGANCNGEPLKCIGLSFLVGGVPGGVLGAIIGSAVKTERWEIVPGSRVRVAVTPLPGRTGIGAALTF